MVDKNKCIGCGACVAICPVGAIKLSGGKAQIDKKKCIGCRSCEQFCPVTAIDIDRVEEDVENKPTLDSQTENNLTENKPVNNK